MNQATVSKSLEISAAHWLPRHTGQCRYLHGHNYRFDVSVTGQVDESTGFVIDFGELKAVIDRVIGPWDHALLTPYSQDTVDSLFSDCSGEWGLLGVTDRSRVVALGEWSTAENLSGIAAREIAKSFSSLPRIERVRVVCWETPTSSASSSLVRSGETWFPGP